MGAYSKIIFLYLLSSCILAHPVMAAAPDATYCNIQTRFFSRNDIDLPLPDAINQFPDGDSPGVLTDSLEVSLAPNQFIEDVDIVVNIEHTYPADLEISVRTPDGKVSILTSGNFNDRDPTGKAFAGTLFDEQAANPISDEQYDFLNPMTIEKAAPEGTLFPGEEGTWELTVADQGAGDSGTLVTWFIVVHYCQGTGKGTVDTAFPGNRQVTNIPAEGGIQSFINISGLQGEVCQVSARTLLEHPKSEELSLKLRSPEGTEMVLSSNNGGSTPNIYQDLLFSSQRGERYNTVTDFDYQNIASLQSLGPEGSFGIFDGEAPNGNWALVIDDETAGTSGVLNGWDLSIVTCAPDGIDEDTVATIVDNCPDDFNQNQADADSDGVGDACDTCPNDPDKSEPGVCGCGVSDADPDSDGVPSCNDACPTDPNKVDPGICGCDVADTDTDSDGVLVCNDGCPEDPEKSGPGTCGCGIPDTDSDNDSTLDCNDLCPNDAQKTEPLQCGCGVADTDADSNGIADCLVADEASFSANSLSTGIDELKFRKKRKAQRAIRRAIKDILANIDAFRVYLESNAAQVFTQGAGDDSALTLEQVSAQLRKLKRQTRRLRKRLKRGRRPFNRGKRKALRTAQGLTASLS